MVHGIKISCVGFLFFCKIFQKGRVLFYKPFIFGILSAWLCFGYTMADEQNQTDATQVAQDPEVSNINNTLEILGWCDLDEIKNATIDEDDEESDLSSRQIQYIQICQHMKNINALEAELSANTSALEENYQNMQDKETSFENRMLGAAGMGTVGIGGMMAASALAEQNTDKSAEDDMRAYLATMQCKVGNNTYSGGTTGIEVGGANQLINMYQQYAELAADLKERKNALGLTPGIEAEIVIDKAASGLYDDVGTGIGSGAYASIARALQDPNGADAQKWNEQKNSASTKLKTGATVAAVGAVASAVANYAMNHNNKDKSQELLEQRAEIKDKFNTLINQIIADCNKNIADAKANIPAQDEYVEEDTNPLTYQQYVEMIKGMQPLKDATEISKIKDIPVCRK